MTKDILYTINTKYIDLMMASFLSLYENSNYSKLRLHLITSNFTKEDYKKVTNFLEQLEVEVFFYSLDDFNIDKFKLPEWRDTQVSNARLFFQEIMKKKIDDIHDLLYLDADTIVKGDLTDIDYFTAKTLGAVLDYGTVRNTVRLNINKYYNSGILNFNVDKWIANNCINKIIKKISSNERKLYFPDQDILNLALEGEISTLPLVYNVNNYAYFYNDLLAKMYFNKKVRQVDYREILEARRNPKILHAYGYSSLKPWSDNSTNPFNDIFMEYIFRVNENFEKEEINDLQKLFDKNPQLFKLLILIKGYMPKFINGKLSDVVNQVNNKFKVKQK